MKSFQLCNMVRNVRPIKSERVGKGKVTCQWMFEKLHRSTNAHPEMIGSSQSMPDHGSSATRQKPEPDQPHLQLEKSIHPWDLSIAGRF
jgi:hypothetical protein